MVTATDPNQKLKFLIWGRNGWIGGQLADLLKEQGIDYEYATSLCEDRAAVAADIDRVKPTHILNAAGLTGRPNVDWCEDHKLDVIRVNVVGALTVTDVAYEKGVHVTLFATGCIFHYDDDFPMNSGKGFKEEDTPNFTGSYYSKTKALVEGLMKEYPNVLILRVRMPIVGDLLYPRNFITKIIKYEKIINIPNSMTVLPELLPYAIEMAKRKLTGIMNYTNPGAVSHNEILEMYKKAIDPDFTWSNFTIEEQAKVVVAPRSNNLLDTTRLESEFPEMLNIHDSIMKYVIEPAAAKKEETLAAVKAMRGR